VVDQLGPLWFYASYKGVVKPTTTSYKGVVKPATLHCIGKPGRIFERPNASTARFSDYVPTAVAPLLFYQVVTTTRRYWVGIRVYGMPALLACLS